MKKLYIRHKFHEKIGNNYINTYSMTIELMNEEVIIDLIHLAIALHDNVVIKEDNSPMHQRGIMPSVVAYLSY
ncbi:hypothetical protein HPG69_014910, partial [Diceros bicornis minor]